MNVFSTASRGCAHNSLPFRPSASSSLRQLHSQLNQQSQSQSQLRSQARLHQHRLFTTSEPRAQAQSTTSSSSTTSTTPPPSSSSSTPSQPSNKSPFLLLGTVSRTGTMNSTIQLTTPKQHFDTFLRKHYTRPQRLLAHDPNPAGFLREGDVVEYGLWTEEEKAAREKKRLELQDRLVEKGVIRLKTRRGKERDLRVVGVKRRGGRWVVRRVISPFGEGVEERMAKLGGGKVMG